jgi:hypothetical protein
MDAGLICQWLELPAVAWPPDHYTLLGLRPAEADAARVEQRAQERLLRLRCYQISHPEQATEAMNRLAQAVVCLTDPTARRQYDASLGLLANGNGAEQTPAAAVERQAAAVSAPTMPAKVGNGAPTPAPVPQGVPSAAMDETAVRPPQTRVDWATAPPPVREVATPAPPPAPAAATTSPTDQVTALAGPTAPAALPSEPADPFLEAARSSPVARRGLGTRRGLYRRLLVTRTLLRLWDQAGKYVDRPKRRLVRPAEGAELARRLARLDQLLHKFPALLGQAGLPGYRVVMLARDDNVGSQFQSLSLAEREALALDWQAGRAVLRAHRHFVGRVVRRLRRQSWLQRGLRSVRAWLEDHPGWVVMVLVVALLLASASVWSAR